MPASSEFTLRERRHIAGGAHTSSFGTGAGMSLASGDTPPGQLHGTGHLNRSRTAHDSYGYAPATNEEEAAKPGGGGKETCV